MNKSSKQTAKDEALLNAARSAEHECGGFAAGHRSIRRVAGTLELLRHCIGDSDGPSDRTDWAVLANMLDDLMTHDVVRINAAFDQLVDAYGEAATR